MTNFLLLSRSNWHTTAELVYWGSLALLFYVYIGYPLFLAAISLFAHSRRAAVGFEPSLSILISAFNEEAHIHEKVQRTLGLDYPRNKFEVLVVSDGSTDGTEDIVRRFADPRVRLLRTSRRGGKTNAQNEGVKACNGDVIVFSDATTVYHSQALRYLAANYRDPKIGAVSGCYQYFDESGMSPTGVGTIVFWSYENSIKRLQSSISTITGCCGCIYSVRKSAYTELAADIISDLVQPLHAIRKGYRVAFEDRALAYESTTQTSREEFSMRVRVITRAIRGILSVRHLLYPWKHPWISFQLISHKVLRWFVAFYLLALLASNALLLDQVGFRATFILQLGFYSLAVLSLVVPLHRLSRLLCVPLYFCTLNVAAVVSVVEVLRGRRYVVWQTIRS